MVDSARPLADRIELRAPWLAALGARAAGRLPELARRRILRAAFARAADAFNRGDLEAVFALFGPEVEYVPPPPLHQGEPLRGRRQALEFWREVLARYDENTIENLALEEAAPGRIVRRARLRHRARGTGETLEYGILQRTELVAGRVVRQVNVLEGEDV